MAYDIKIKKEEPKTEDKETISGRFKVYEGTDYIANVYFGISKKNPLKVGWVELEDKGIRLHYDVGELRNAIVNNSYLCFGTTSKDTSTRIRNIKETAKNSNDEEIPLEDRLRKALHGLKLWNETQSTSQDERERTKNCFKDLYQLN